MRVGFHYHIPAHQNQRNEIKMPGYLGVFIDGLANECSELICFLHSPMPSELSLMDYTIRKQNVKLVTIGPHDDLLQRALNRKKYLRTFMPEVPKIDIMLIRGPSPLLPSVAALCEKYHTPYSYLLVGDYLKSLAGVREMNPLKRATLWLYYKFNKFGQDRFVREALLFTNNHVIFNEYSTFHQNAHEIRTTTLSESAFNMRDCFALNAPVKLAYAGRIEPSKGIDDMLEAVGQLRKEGVMAELHVAGWDSTTKQDQLHSLKQLADKLELKNSFIYHGKKQVGPELLSFYRSCDIFLIATKGNEGFPRTIWEAMSQCMPVISTKVGSIPQMLKDESDALFVDQGNPKQLSNAIIRLIKDSELRRRIATNGYILAQGNTIELQSKKMLNAIREFLPNEKIKAPT